MVELENDWNQFQPTHSGMCAFDHCAVFSGSVLAIFMELYNA